MSRKPNLLPPDPSFQPWIEAERLWDKDDPEIRALISATIASDPRIEEGRRRRIDDKNTARRYLLLAPSVAASSRCSIPISFPSPIPSVETA
jgi:hypothetical protein